MTTPVEARRIRVTGVVQGVGFRPFVYRLASVAGLHGWVLNGDDGVSIHVEGGAEELATFLRELESSAPPAARIATLEWTPVAPTGTVGFAIRASHGDGRPTVRISPDLCLCDACRRELLDAGDRRYRYPYINCTDCGPRYSIVLGLPYDRPLTTMREWPMCAACGREYHDPADRRFHAQPVACPACGPLYVLRRTASEIRGTQAVESCAELLDAGAIVAIKGLGGYHLACDARSPASVEALRTRKYRKEKPFAVMARDLDVAGELVEMSPDVEALLTSTARPIVLARARQELAGVAPGNRDLGLMLPYTPLHELLFHNGAPAALVMTSGNRSSEPIAFEDHEALERLDGLADAFLIGERPIARRVDDSVVRAGSGGPIFLRRARGYAPGVICRIPTSETLLAVGADLKNTLTLVVGGEAIVSQHVGDLRHFEARQAFERTIADLIAMYELDPDELVIVHDEHPDYASTAWALAARSRACRAVQHHRAHLASVVAEHEAWSERVVGVVFDGTGFGDDGTIWGGELFVGSVEEGFERVGSLRPARLPGGDAAARHPVQAAAGFLAELPGVGDLTAPPFGFPRRFAEASQLIERDLRVFATTSAGRLFDTVAAIAGFTRPVSFEGQAAIWLEHLARAGGEAGPYPMPVEERRIDYRPALERALADRAAGARPETIAAAFHRGLALGVCDAVAEVAEGRSAATAALSGGVFQNQLLTDLVRRGLERVGLQVWVHHAVPANDGGVSLGQAALAAAGCAERR